MNQEQNNLATINSNEEKRTAEVQEAAEEVMEILAAHRVTIWGDVLAAVTSAIFAAKIDAAEIAQEEAAFRALMLTPGMTIDLNSGNGTAVVKIEGQAVSAGTIVSMAADMIEDNGKAAAEG